MKTDGELFSVKFRVTRATMFFGGAAVVTFLYYKFPAYADLLKFGGVAAAASAALYNANIARKTFETSVRDKKLALASEFFCKYYGADGATLRNAFKKIQRDLSGKTSHEIAAIVGADEDMSETVREVLNLWEEAGYAARRGRIDVAMADDLFGTGLVRIYEFVSPLLPDYRRRNNQSTAWEHFEWLCSEVKKRRAQRSD